MLKILTFVTELVGWLQIQLSIFLLSVGFGAIIYFTAKNTTTLVIAIIISIFGFILGVYYATKMWKTKGTFWLASRVSGPPENDENGSLTITNDNNNP